MEIFRQEEELWDEEHPRKDTITSVFCLYELLLSVLEVFGQSLLVENSIFLGFPSPSATIISSTILPLSSLAPITAFQAAGPRTAGQFPMPEVRLSRQPLQVSTYPWVDYLVCARQWLLQWGCLALPRPPLCLRWL